MNIKSYIFISLTFYQFLACANNQAFRAISPDAQVFETISTHMKYPTVLTQNSSAQMMDSVSAILDTYKISRADLNTAFLFTDRSLAISSKFPTQLATKKHGPVPLTGLVATHAVVFKVSKGLGLSDTNAHELAFREEKNIVEALGENWGSYQTLILPIYRSLGFNFSKNLVTIDQTKKALDEVMTKVTVDRTYNIPYLAGYATLQPKKLYIDSGLADPSTLPSGEKMSTIPFLAIHEAYEKALIDELKLNHKSYLRTHQMAQRLEKETVEANSVTWNDYQHKIMDPEIDRADSAPITRVPRDLDLTPYIDYEDWEVIKRMKAVMVD